MEKLAIDGATPCLLLKTQSLACRSRGMRTISLARSAPGEKLIAIYTRCRYGPNWARDRGINCGYRKNGNNATLDLGLDANLKITSLTGFSDSNIGETCWILQAKLSNGATWGPHGPSELYESESERPSPSSPPLVLSHLSGDESYGARIIRFHWRPQ